MDQEFPAAAPDLTALRRRLLWATLLWALAVALGAWWVSHARVLNFRQEAERNGNLRISSVQDNLENHFRSMAALGQVLARQPAFIDFLRLPLAPEPSQLHPVPPTQLQATLTARPEVQALSARLQHIVADFEIRQIYVQDAYGTSVADSYYDDARYSTIGHNFHIRDYFIGAMDTGAGFQFVMGRVSHQPGFNFSARIDDGNRARGIVILKSDPASMARLFTDDAGRALHVVDANGVIVAGNQPESALRQVPGGPSLKGRDEEMLGAYTTLPQPLDWHRQALNLGKRQAHAIVAGQARFLLQTRQLKGYPYTLWMLTPLGPERDVQISTALGAVVVLAGGWLLIWAYLKRSERQGALDQVRRETLEMTRALPLTLFRYRVAPDGQGRFAYIGPGATGLFGEDEASLSAKAARLWGAAEGATAATPPTNPVEFSVRHGAHKRWVSVNSAMATSPDGGRVFDGYWLDVTDKHEAEQRFEAAFAHASSAFMFFHRQRGILRCNPAALAMFGAAHFAQLEGLRPWLPPLSPAHQPDGSDSTALATQLMDTHREGQPTGRIAWRLSRLDGSSFDAEIMLLSLGIEDDDLYFASIEDVTVRKQTEEALRAASQAAQENTRAKSAFLANMSHEIRTPMNAIIGMTHLALDDAPPDKLRQYVYKAHQAANNLLQIINDVLDMSKIEAGHLELECIDFALQDVLDQVADVLGLPAERKGLELLFTAPPGLPSHLMGDPTRLRQILVNLGSNAVKFTDSGSVTIGLEVQHQAGIDLVLHGWVRDTGMGMSAAQQEKLFQPFSQADTSTTRRFGGTGLGLTISRQLAERMGGQLWVESERHQGATFHFTVRMSLPAHHQPMASLSEDWQGKRVLLVDDSADARLVLGQMAGQLGLAVDVATNGDEALARARQAERPYDWVLLDWKMPGMDGLTCARHLHEMARSRFPNDNPCILLVTAFNRADALRAAQETPLADVLTKPVTPSSLFDSLSRARLHREGTPPPAPVPPPAPTRLPVPDLHGVRILLVEDQPLNQELAKELLTRAGAEVTIAEDGAEALRHLEQDPPFNCVLMDCQMPRMDGYTATERVRSNPRWRHLPIIAMTASALVSDRERALAAGMNDHVPKPLDVNQMYLVVSRWVDIARRVRDEV